MALDPKKLKDSILEILENPPDSKVRASFVWAEALSNWTKDAEFLGVAPAVHPTSGVTVPANFKFKVNSGLVSAGAALLQPLLLTSFLSNDPTFLGLQTSIAAYIPTLAVWSGGGFTATVVTIPSPLFITPGYFSSVIASGLARASTQQVATQLSGLIYAGFIASLLNGTAVNPAGFVAPVVASPII